MDDKLNNLPDYFFAYGSQMWAPSFHFIDSSVATLRGYSRSFCVNSTIYRGTCQNPGLVLGLVPGGSCQGILYQLATKEKECEWEKIFAKEMPGRHQINGSQAYLPQIVKVTNDLTQEEHMAIVLVVDMQSSKYSGELNQAEIVRRLVKCQGQAGSNLEYFENTLQHLTKLNLKDEGLLQIESQIRQIVINNV